MTQSGGTVHVEPITGYRVRCDDCRWTDLYDERGYAEAAKLGHVNYHRAEAETKALLAQSGRATMADDGVWMTYHYDWSGFALFATEVEALRDAVDKSRVVGFAPYGEDFGGGRTPPKTPQSGRKDEA